ncbi:unnamed protein product [Owenia fusiformis]|uniref:N-acetyltransferase 9-like protein n=1 Tax=Owenia fusiformis TaxID=6347 RepID=A0A8J1Y5I6_OWEFU|nr:unnamed protein product [Owenia fusiformis]
MKQNQNMCIIGNDILLIPYKAKHVPKYHDWMKSEELQKLTASEPLTLEEEYSMQQAWAEDADKCTFIILSKEDYNVIHDEASIEEEAMAGDVNIFFNDPDEKSSAELEIMIAEKRYRKKGLGKEALLAMMKYGIDELNVSVYTVKIGFDNNISLNMFTKLGFSEVSKSEVFKEVTLQLDINEDFLKYLDAKTEHLKIVEYPTEH